MKFSIKHLLILIFAVAVVIVLALQILEGQRAELKFLRSGEPLKNTKVKFIVASDPKFSTFSGMTNSEGVVFIPRVYEKTNVVVELYSESKFLYSLDLVLVPSNSQTITLEQNKGPRTNGTVAEP